MISDRMKQRLVGVSVLIALAVIFIPVLFNLQPSQPLDETTQIPSAPDISPVEFQEPIQPEVDNEVLPHEEAFAVEEESPEQLAMPVTDDIENSEVVKEREVPVQSREEIRSAAQTQPRLLESGLPESWIIQAASYGKLETAEQLVARLQKAQFKAFAKPASVGGRQVYRVFVGPYISRKSAQDEKKLIDNALRVESIILAFEP